MTNDTDSDTDVVAVAAPPTDDWVGLEDELGGELPAPKQRLRMGKVTWVLIGLLAVAGGFYAGVRVEKNNAPTTTAAGGANAFAAFAAGGGRGAANGATATTVAGGPAAPGAGANQGQGQGQQGTGGAGGAGGAGGGRTIGTVKLVDGTNVYVADSAGNTVKVLTTPESRVTRTVTGTVADLKPGDAVVVTGAAAADGTVTATAVTTGGAGGFGGGTGRNGG